MFCAKNGSKKHQIFEKWETFENQPFCKGYSAGNGYSLCKIVSLGQKLKIPKTCEKTFYKNTRVVLCKKRLEKTPNIRAWDTFENRPFCKGYSAGNGYSLFKIVSLGQNLKIPKTCEETFYKNTRVVLCKRGCEKTPNIREMRQFKKSAILQRL